MKKALKTILFISVITFILSAYLTVAASEDDPFDIPLEQRLIGTWRWEDQYSYIVVFREEGTMLDGPPGLRTLHNWQIVNGRLFVDGADLESTHHRNHHHPH